jgi:hypothetical protein
LISVDGPPGQVVTLMTTVPEASYRLRGMFLDVQGTHLSVADASRLSGIDCSICQHVLEALVDVRFLKRGLDGRFTRRQADTVDN